MSRTQQNPTDDSDFIAGAGVGIGCLAILLTAVIVGFITAIAAVIDITVDWHDPIFLALFPASVVIVGGIAIILFRGRRALIAGATTVIDFIAIVVLAIAVHFKS